jgi:hypothetical protein
MNSNAKVMAFGFNVVAVSPSTPIRKTRGPEAARGPSPTADPDTNRMAETTTVKTRTAAKAIATILRPTACH